MPTAAPARRRQPGPKDPGTLLHLTGYAGPSALWGPWFEYLA